MAYPYEVLGVDPQADDRTIRKAYLTKIRAHTPENEPEYFQELTGSYNLIKGNIDRAKLKVFGVYRDMPSVTLRGLVLNNPGERTRIGIENWISFLSYETKGGKESGAE